MNNIKFTLAIVFVICLLLATLMVFSTEFFLQNHLTKTKSKPKCTESHDDEDFTFPQAQPGAILFNFTLHGVLLDSAKYNDSSCVNQAVNTRDMSAHVTTTVLHQFSPFVNNHFKRMFAGHVANGGQLSPFPFQVSCEPHHGALTCVFRVWINHPRSGALAGNFYQDSFLYSMQLSRNLSYIPGSGKVLGIPSAVQDRHYSGPEDPRLFIMDDTLYVDFINVHNYPAGSGLRRQFLWSTKESVIYDVEVSGLSMNNLEKNWTPWVYNGSLHFIYQFLPVMRVMKCNIETSAARCSFTAGGGLNGQPLHIKTSNMFFRGGSPAVHYSGDYYLVLTHSVQKSPAKYYSAHMALFHSVTTTVVFVSSPIVIDPAKMLSMPITDSSIQLPFLYPRSAFIEDKNSLVFSAGLNDNECFVVRLEGFADLLKKAIESHEKLSSSLSGKCLDAISTAVEKFEPWTRDKTNAEHGRYFNGQHPPGV